MQKNTLTERQEFANRLRKARLKTGLTGKQIAEQLNISYPTYMSYEKKGSQPKPKRLAEIANALGVSTNYLLTGEEEKKQNISDFPANATFRIEKRKHFIPIDIDNRDIFEILSIARDWLQSSQPVHFGMNDVIHEDTKKTALKKIAEIIGQIWMDERQYSNNPLSDSTTEKEQEYINKQIKQMIERLFLADSVPTFDTYMDEITDMAKEVHPNKDNQ